MKVCKTQLRILISHTTINGTAATFLKGGVRLQLSSSPAGSSSAFRFVPASGRSGVGDFDALNLACTSARTDPETDAFVGVKRFESVISGVITLLDPAPSARNFAANVLDVAISA